jgi:transposase
MCARSSAGRAPRECVYDNLRSVVARREGERVDWTPRFLHLRGHYGFHASACTPASPREKGSVEAAVRYLKTGFWPARRFGSLRELDRAYGDWRDQRCNVRVHSSDRLPVADRLAEERGTLRAAGEGEAAVLDLLQGETGAQIGFVSVTARTR